MRRLPFAFLLAALLALPARATTFSTDYSDLWWNSNESGWGVNVIQQEEILFMTFFVYSTSTQPIWFVAPATAFTDFSSGMLTFSGPLYQTNGPWCGGAFNPAAVGNREVGTASFRGGVTTATLTYTVEGVSTTKSLTRQTWRMNDLAGDYLGATIGTYSGCPPGINGYIEDPVDVSVSQSGTSLTMTTLDQSGTTCTYRGTYIQAGRMGRVSGGTVSCTDGSSGTFSAFEIEAGITGLTARASANFGSGCMWNGRFGGLRRGP